MARVVSAVFDSVYDAQQAVDWLRGNGVNDHAISIIQQRGDDYESTGEVDRLRYDRDLAERTHDARTEKHVTDAGKRTLVGAGVGATVGALFGLAAVAIPGAGPFIAAGALANVLGVTAGGAVAGAAVGATAGGMAGALTSWGVPEDESKYYAGEIERGGTWVGVNLDETDASAAAVRDAFRRFNGRFQPM